MLSLASRSVRLVSVAKAATTIRAGFATAPGRVPLCEQDPELFDLIEKEKNRSWKSLEMIAYISFCTYGFCELCSLEENHWKSWIPSLPI